MNLGRKKQTSLLMQTPNKMIKGILGSFTPIDQDQRWVKGLLESSGVTHYTGKSLDACIPIGQAAR